MIATADGTSMRVYSDLVPKLDRGTRNGSVVYMGTENIPGAIMWELSGGCRLPLVHSCSSFAYRTEALCSIALPCG
jgi:hypothetical protein